MECGGVPPELWCEFPHDGEDRCQWRQCASLYDFLKKSSRILTKDIKWNFTKFLISRDGTVLERFAPQTEPSKFEDQVREALGV